MRDRLINGLAIVSLFIAFYIGQTDNNGQKYDNTDLLSNHHITRIEYSDRGDVSYDDSSLIGCLAVGNAQGYGGPLQVIVLADSTGKISHVYMGKNSETLAYINKLKRKSYFDQYESKALNSKFIVAEDVEAVSGATISSVAIANACREASWRIANNRFSLALPYPEKKWIFGLREALAIVIFILAFFTAFLKSKTIRNVSLGVSLVVLGFMFNSAISVAHFGRLFLGYLPDIRAHFVWWLLLGGTILGIFIYGRNLYCHAMCPFHAVQIILNKLSGLNIHVSPKAGKYLIRTPKILLWLSLLLILLSKNSTIASYEPFAMVFSLEGVGIQWYILPAALFGSLIVSDFFCRYFCPVGAGFNLLLKFRSRAIKTISKRHGEK